MKLTDGSKLLFNNARLLVIILATIVVIILSLAGIGVAMNKYQNYSLPKEVTEITVSYRDTLWTIAQKIAPGIDPRRVVWEIQELNQIKSSQIFPGQTLQVPVYETSS